MIVWDTSILIARERKDRTVESTLELLHQRYHGQIAIAAPTYTEFLFGFLVKKPSQQSEIEEYLGDFVLLHTTRGSCTRTATIKYRLRQKGRIIADMDIVIAALVIEYGGVLVTRDKQFKEIEELQVEVI